MYIYAYIFVNLDCVCVCSSCPVLRGQVLPAHTLLNTVDVELIYEGTKFVLKVTRQSSSSYVVLMNGSCIEVDVHRLSDGGLLLSYDGSSYTTYMKEEVDRYTSHQHTIQKPQGKVTSSFFKVVFRFNIF